MVDVKVLGPGCPNCQKLEARVRNVIQRYQLEASIEKVTDYAQIMRWNVMRTPGLVVNDVLVAAGRIPSEEEIADWLKQ
ncbi:thioredoxin family protein [Chloroflexus sp.]|uniref:thioredoxin family protein n=1 Tax=Chloroflexus sp. TaxID=1904827 RepID=UPI002ACE8A1F|nr:thioredoxin family protein [Chloroflexus sp.]